MPKGKTIEVDFKIGDRVFLPKLNKSGEIVLIQKYDNPYTKSTYYYVVLDADVKYKDKLKNPCATFSKESLQPDNTKIIQLSLL